MKRRLFVLFVAFALVLTACGGQIASEATPTPFPTPVRPTFTVQRGDITVEAKLSGRVVPLVLEGVYFESGPQRIDVGLGLQTRDRVEIVSGLEEGQVVVGP